MEVVVGLVEVVEQVDSDYLAVEVEAEVWLLLRLLLLFLPVAVQENWFDRVVAGDPQVHQQKNLCIATRHLALQRQFCLTCAVTLANVPLPYIRS